MWLGNTMGPIKFDELSGFDPGTDEGSVLMVVDEVGQIHAIERIPRSDHMRGRLGSIVAAAAVAAASAGTSIFDPNIGRSYDAGSLQRNRELRAQEREARREQAMSKAESKRNRKNAERRQRGGYGR